jgi:hypothetical protein
MKLIPLSTFLSRLHRDQRGAISLLSVFGIFLFTILLGQIMNIGRQVDDKLRMQNAADAAAYSGGVSIARGMNAIAFSNHILCETFALTAYMREGRDRHSDAFIPPILAAWQAVGDQYANGTRSQKFQGLGRAIVEKVPLEQQMVDRFSELAYRQSRVTLPELEYLLMGPDQNPRQPMPPDPLGGFIPRFQRAVVQTTPMLALAASDDLARRYGQSSQSLHRGEALRAFFWRTNVEVAGTGNEYDPWTRTIPALDPSPTGPDAGALSSGGHYCLARTRRSQLAHHYLRNWISHWQGPYFEWDGSGPRGHETAKMSNYINFFRVFSCGQLERLLNEEYPDTNLPHVLREIWDDPNPANPCGCIFPQPDPERFLYQTVQQENEVLERDYNFVATAAWPQMTTMMPGLYQNPLHRGRRTYAVTFAQAEVSIPRARYVCCPWVTTTCYDLYGDPQPCFHVHVDNWQRQWDLFNQNWTVRLVPATAATLPQILETHPQNFVPGVLSNYQPPQLGATLDEFRLVNGH